MIEPPAKVLRRTLLAVAGWWIFLMLVKLFAYYADERDLMELVLWFEVMIIPGLTAHCYYTTRRAYRGEPPNEKEDLSRPITIAMYVAVGLFVLVWLYNAYATSG